MPLSILVRLRGGSYDAGGERPSESEWPPHPARVFCALAASAESDADWAALRWLEQQGPPQVWAAPSDQVNRSRTRAYVVQNAVEKGGGNLTWPARTNGWRARAFAVPPRDSFAIVWPEARPSADTLSRLSLLAWKVPYIGRSTSTAQVSIAGVMPDDMPGTVIYRPAEFGAGGRLWDLRVPYAGYADALRDAYDDGRRSWEVTRARPYTAVQGRPEAEDSAREPEAVAGPFADLLVWKIERPVARVGGDFVVSLTTALRRAVLSQVPDPVPGQVSGYTEPGRPHVDTSTRTVMCSGLRSRSRVTCPIRISLLCCAPSCSIIR
jgi:CRISPR-associated protein Csb2